MSEYEVTVTMSGEGISVKVLPDGSVVYPCRCGQDHGGTYGQEDRNHHECLHDVDLDDMGHGQVICMDCGRTWLVTPAPPGEER